MSTTLETLRGVLRGAADAIAAGDPMLAVRIARLTIDLIAFSVEHRLRTAWENGTSHVKGLLACAGIRGRSIVGRVTHRLTGRVSHV